MCGRYGRRGDKQRIAGWMTCTLAPNNETRDVLRKRVLACFR